MHFEKIKPTKISRCPRHVLAICCEHSPDVHPATPGVKQSISVLRRWSLCQRRFTESGVWLNHELQGETADELWKVLFNLVRGRRECWIVTPSVSEWLAVADGYAMLTMGHLWLPGLTNPSDPDLVPDPKVKHPQPGYLILGGPTEILTGRLLATSVHCVSATNYGIDDFNMLMKEHGEADAALEISVTGADRWTGITAPIARTLAKWYTAMIDRWRRADCGTWGHTAAQLSHSYYRRRFAKGRIVEHETIEAHRLERAAMFGGRAEIYRWKPYRGTAYRIDARSLYPWILRENPLPGALSFVSTDFTVHQVREAIKDWHCIAQVSLEATNPDYPVKIVSGGYNRGELVGNVVKNEWVPRTYKTMFPIGPFTTTLAGPELRHAIETEAVSKVWSFAAYRSTTEVQPMMEELLRMRDAAKAAGDNTGERFAKLLANSFAGKFARRPGGWVIDRRFAAAEAWSEWVEDDPDTREPRRCRSIGFVPQVWKEKTDEPHGVPVILAWLTSMGRWYLRELIRTCGEDELLAVDTDGLWCTQEGLERLQGGNIPFGAKPGQIRIVEQARAVHHLTPRHYCVDGRWVMSGFAAGFAVISQTEVHDYSRQSLYPANSADGPQGVIVTHRKCDVAEIADFARVRCGNGRTVPYSVLGKPIEDGPLQGLLPFESLG